MRDIPLPPQITIDGQHMSIDDVVYVARQHVPVRITEDPVVHERVQASCDLVQREVQAGRPIYGVTSGFGGMAHLAILPEDTIDLQNNLPKYHKTGVGQPLSDEDIRASMLLRANTLLRGASAIRMEVIDRLVQFLNAEVTPVVYDLGSIGASGDLVPLSYIAGCLIGLDETFEVHYQGEKMPASHALERLGIGKQILEPKEGLALINGTSVMSGVAALCIHDTLRLLCLTLASHALMIEALGGTNQSFHPFIHQHRPHPGSVWCAARMLNLMEGSQFIRDELEGSHEYRKADLLQDRYSLRCLAQYLGPMVEGIRTVARQVTVEINSTTDNPLFDAERGIAYHGGNFLGEYVGVGMDQLRFYIGMLAKHLDIQITLLVAPEFSRGLPPCLIGNTNRSVNMGLKGLQLTSNSIVPLLQFYGNPIVDRYPPYAEQFNQNINSQGFNAANLARKSVNLFRDFTAISLMFAIQAVDLRAYAQLGKYDARLGLSHAGTQLYEAIREVLGVPPSEERPYIWNDSDRSLDSDIQALGRDIASDGQLVAAVQPLMDSLTDFMASGRE